MVVLAPSESSGAVSRRYICRGVLHSCKDEQRVDDAATVDCVCLLSVPVQQQHQQWPCQQQWLQLQAY
jgi:hypothetical protein